MFSRVHTKARNRLTYKKLDLIVFIRYNLKLKLRCAKRKTEEEVSESFNPINLDYIFEDEEDPFNLWLSEREQPVFEEDNLNWLNLNENEINAVITGEDDASQLPDPTPPYRYSTDQPEDIHDSDGESEGHLSPSPSHDGNGDGGSGTDPGSGGGGNGGARDLGSSHTSRRSTEYFDDRPRCDATGGDDTRSRRSSREQPTEPRQTYRRLRKGKEPVQQHGQSTETVYGYQGIQDLPPSFTGSNPFGFGPYDTYGQALSEHRHSSYGCPPSYFPPNVPQFEQQTQYDARRQHPDYPQIINHGTINYGDHHYYSPTFYSGTDNSNTSDQSWMNSTASSMFEPPQGSYGVDKNNNDTYQEPPRHSFWW